MLAKAKWALSGMLNANKMKMHVCIDTMHV